MMLKLVTTTTTEENEQKNYHDSSSTSTRAHALARETLINMAVEGIRQLHADILGRPMPRYTEQQLISDLEAGTPAAYYRYALKESAFAPYPSWRYAMAIVARLKRQRVDEADLIFLDL